MSDLIVMHSQFAGTSELPSRRAKLAARIGRAGRAPLPRPIGDGVRGSEDPPADRRSTGGLPGGARPTFPAPLSLH